MTIYTRQKTELTDKPTISLVSAVKKYYRELIKLLEFHNDKDNIKFHETLIDVIDANEFLIVSIKFRGTYRRVKIFINKSDVDSFEIVYMEKTRNIVENIDNISGVLARTYDKKTKFLDNAFLSKFIEDTFNWGYTSDITRAHDLFKVPGINIDLINQVEMSRNDVLYFGIIKKVEVLSEVHEVKEVIITLLEGAKLPLVLDNERYNLLKEGHILIMNYDKKFNVMMYIHAKKHIIFDYEDSKLIQDCLDKIKEKQND